MTPSDRYRAALQEISLHAWTIEDALRIARAALAEQSSADLLDEMKRITRRGGELALRERLLLADARLLCEEER